MDLCVCIPTYRRNEQLAELLAAMQTVAAPGKGDVTCRILVIDNNPNGEARPIVERAAAEAGPFPIFYTHEVRPGVTHVRNTALEANEQSDFLVFIDDDELPTQGWLNGLWATWEETGAAAIFGPVEAKYQSSAPAWMIEMGLHDCPVGEATLRTEPGYTNNCLIHLPTARALNLRFDPALTLTGGEDVDFFDQLLRNGKQLANAPDAWVTEIVPEDRTRAAWLKRRWRREGATDAMLKYRRRGAEGSKLPALLQAAPRLVIGGSLTAVGLLLSGGKLSPSVVKRLFTFQRGRGMIDFVFDKRTEEYGRSTTGPISSATAKGAEVHG